MEDFALFRAGLDAGDAVEAACASAAWAEVEARRWRPLAAAGAFRLERRAGRCLSPLAWCVEEMCSSSSLDSSCVS